MQGRLNIYNYTNYRSFLQASFDEAKRKNSSWSYGAWSYKLGLSSNATIIKIMTGSREAGPSVTQKLVEYFKFNNDERAYFEDLVRLAKLKKDPRMALSLMEQMRKRYPKVNVQILDEEVFKAISGWWFYTIRQLSKITKLKNDPEWIAKQLRFKVSTKEIKRAIDIMLEKNLMIMDEQTGVLYLSDGALDTTNNVTSEAIRLFHETMMENAKIAIREMDVSERILNGHVVAIDKHDLNLAQEFLREMVNEFCERFEVDHANAVYHFQYQLFPLTKEIEKN